MDVTSLYTNIPNREGITAVISFLNTCAIKQLTPIITTFLRLVNTLYSTTQTFYRLMEYPWALSCCAPAYANLFIGNLKVHQ